MPSGNTRLTEISTESSCTICALFLLVFGCLLGCLLGVLVGSVTAMAIVTVIRSVAGLGILLAFVVVVVVASTPNAQTPIHEYVCALLWPSHGLVGYLVDVLQYSCCSVVSVAIKSSTQEPMRMNMKFVPFGRVR
jgi:hypothetical protein